MANATETVDFAGEAPLRGRRVLVADGQSGTRWSTVGVLRDAGARVAEARDGVEALELARVQPPDLILAEAALPRLDGLGLCAAIRKEPALQDVTVVLIADGGPPQALWEPSSGSRSLVDAVRVALEKRSPAGAAEASSGESAPARASTGRHARVGRMEDGWDPGERENLRAQSSLAMHRQPANQVASARAPVWRRRVREAATSDARDSGFDPDPTGMSRVLGIAFVVLLAVTVARLLWPEAPPVSSGLDERPAEVDASPPTSAPPPETAAETRPAREPDRVGAAPGEAAGRDGAVTAFSGTLRSGVDPSLDVGDGQGVLELDGPETVRVEIDGTDRGSLPGAWVLDGGRHAVRYRVDGRGGADAPARDRFYLVVPGATRAVRVLTRPGGFVDAH